MGICQKIHRTENTRFMVRNSKHVYKGSVEREEFNEVFSEK